MRCLAALLALVCLVEARPTQLDLRPSISFDPYILGGQDALPGEFPWQLSQLRGGSHSCGASLLTPTAALSAAHCVDGALVSSVEVIAGLHQRSNLTGTQTSAAAAFTIHETYDNGEGTFAHDISIITLVTAIDTSPSNIDLLTLPPDNSDQFVGVTCALSGWGRTSASNILPDTLQKVHIEVISTDECNIRMANVIGADCTDNQISVYDIEAEDGSCNGDSGGPMNCPLNGLTVVAGITSWGIQSGGACAPSYPSVYTRTSAYLQWIFDNTPAS